MAAELVASPAIAYRPKKGKKCQGQEVPVLFYFYGKAQTRSRYDSFGQAINLSGGSPYRFSYSGREADATGLMYYRNRYYVPSAGRFTQPDPAGFADGPNLFGYVGNNPMSFIDPMGLSAQNPNLPQNSFYAGLSTVGSVAVTVLPFYDLYAAYNNPNATWGDWAWGIAAVVPIGKAISLASKGIKAVDRIEDAARATNSTGITFVDEMTPAEAKRYQEYWNTGGDTAAQVSPGIRVSHTETVPSSRAGEVYERTTYYDEYGRRRQVTDYTDHSMPEGHTNPHDHYYNEVYDNGVYTNKKIKNPETGSTTFNR